MGEENFFERMRGVEEKQKMFKKKIKKKINKIKIWLLYFFVVFFFFLKKRWSFRLFFREGVCFVFVGELARVWKGKILKGKKGEKKGPPFKV